MSPFSCNRTKASATASAHQKHGMSASVSGYTTFSAAAVLERAATMPMQWEQGGAPLSPSSRVNRSRDQSQEAPRRRSCWVMKPPYSRFHCHTRASKASRPISLRLAPSAASIFSTTICAAVHALQLEQNCKGKLAGSGSRWGSG